MQKLLKNRYAVVEQVGRGGMAEIFRARMKGPHGFEKEVCIKRILSELSSHAGFEAMFLDEARIAATLAHANIVQVFDFDRDEEGRFFLVMEYVDGVNLKGVLLEAQRRGRSLEAGLAAAVARAVLQALHHAWTKQVDGIMLRVVHRDLSPHNILLSRDGEIKITDFGIAKAVTSAVRTRTGVIKGKLVYMSPEQAAGRKTDQRSDMYSLGVVLWEMLAGRRLFERACDERRSVTPEERCCIPSLQSLRGGVPAPFSSFIGNLLQADPARRPPGAFEALEALDRVCPDPFSSVKTQKLLQELGLFTPRAGAEAGVEAPARGGEPGTASLSPPGSDSTLKPLSTYSTATLMKSTQEKKGAIHGRTLLRLAIPLVLVLACLAAPAVHLLAKRGSGGREKTAASPSEARPSFRAAGFHAMRETGDERQSDGTEGRAAAGADPASIAAAHEAGASPKTGEKPAAKAASVGWLSVNVRPWAEVIIDGKKIGYTPQHRLSLAPGPHRLVLRNPKLGIEKELKITIRKKRETSLTLDFSK
jgi:serine/threonine protein kinase